MKYLIGYDISNPKRLQRLHRRMQKHATPVQYSVFLFEGNARALQSCLDEALSIIEKKEDDLRLYPLTVPLKRWELGKPVLPDGIVWTALN